MKKHIIGLLILVVIVLIPGFISSRMMRQSENQELTYTPQGLNPKSQAYRTRERALIVDLPWVIPSFLMRIGPSPQSYEEEFEDMLKFHSEAWATRCFFLALLGLWGDFLRSRA